MNLRTKSVAIAFLVVLIIIIPCYIAQGMANFSYGQRGPSQTHPVHRFTEAEQQTNAKFGKSNMMIPLCPARQQHHPRKR